MQKLPILKPGDCVEIIAPASRCLPEQLTDLIKLLESWALNCIVDKDIFGNDLLCANTDEFRFNALKNALLRPETKAIICARGGYGSMRLIPELIKVQPPANCKLFLGMSDLTALNLYLQQQWQWPIIHGALALDKFSPESIDALRLILFGKITQNEFIGIGLNDFPGESTIEASIIGGNLSLVQASIGTAWQINASNKIVFLEEINERGYRIDRMLEHLYQANIFENAKAIVFGDFLEGKEPNGTSLVDAVLARFAEMRSTIPVVQIKGVGHGHDNFPMPLGTKATLLKSRGITKLTTYR